MKLTARETQVRELRVAGLTIDQTAERLGIRPSTVSKHRASGAQKLALRQCEPPDAAAAEGAD